MDGGTSKKTHFRKKHCSPTKKRLKYSCLSHKLLLRIAKALNNILEVKLKTKPYNDKQLYNKICDIMKHKFNCNTEACWLSIRKLMNQLSSKDVTLFKQYFRPSMPDNIVDDYTEWISNFDIESVMNQYNKDLNDFYFYGAVPIDFKKCSVSDLCKFNLKEHIDNGIQKIGIIFNTDKSTEPGKHWISMYIDITGRNLDGQPGIYFFDSFANNLVKEIKELIKSIQNKGEKLNIEFISTNNTKSIQNNTYSCGFYCMHFLEHMVLGYPFKKYLKSGLNDKKMIQYRNHCYLNPKEI